MSRLPNVHLKLKKILLPMVGIFFVSLNMVAQSLTCTDRNTTLDGTTCMNTFTAADLGGDNSIHTLFLETPSGVAIANNEISNIHVGQKLTYTITLTSTGAILCWAYLNVEDKAVPIITCPIAAELNCAQSTEILATATDTNPLLNAKATDCFGDLTVTSFDQVRNLDCQENALNFDGEDDRVQFNDFALASTDFTFEFWINPESSNPSYVVTNRTTETDFAGNWFSIEHSNNGANSISLWMGAGTGSGAAIFSNGVALPNEWTHVSVVRSGTSIIIYLNGELDNTVLNVPVRSLSVTSNTAFLGTWNQRAGTWFDGSLDDLRLWSDVRSATEISGNYNRELNGNETGLKNYYTFNQGLAEMDNTSPPINTLNDEKTTLNGTLFNFALNTGVSNWVNNRFDADEYSQIITRTFVATGTNGKTTSCTQEIRIERADIQDVTMPANFSASCSATSSTDPIDTGYPTYDPDGIGGIDAINLVPGETGGACMLLSAYTDSAIPKCGPEQLIKRSWQVINMCQQGGIPNEMIMMDQIITITTPDPIIDPIADVTISADAGVAGIHSGCSSTGDLPMATVSGLCTGQVVQPSNIVISIPGIGQISNGGSITSPGLALGGPYIVTYMATDDCGNVGTLDVQVTVVDKTAPQCNTQNVNVTLTPDGTATVGFASFDRNSSDNCSASVWTSVRRLNGLCTTAALDDFGPTVDFCCDDVPMGTEAEVMVQQLVCDKDPSLASNYSDNTVLLNADGSPGSTFSGNCSRCMAIATVKLNGSSSVVCPNDTTITCAEYNEASLYGEPTITSSCGNISMASGRTDVPNIGCNGGTVTRTFTDATGATICTQIITLTGGQLIINPSDITLDDDLDCAAFDCNNRPDTLITGAPRMSGINCTGTTIEFEFADSDNCDIVDGSLTFSRTFTIKAGTDPLNCFPNFSYVQTIVTRANCCFNPFQSLTESNDGAIALALTRPESEYTIEWFDVMTNTQFENAAFPDVMVSANNLMVTGLIDGQAVKVELEQNNNSACTYSFETTAIVITNLNGQIFTEFGAPVQNVRVALESNQAARVIGKDDIMSEVMTDEEGSFEFDEVDLRSLNKLTLVKDGDDRDNVSTRDLLRMARHILGIKEISSPYSYIAADLTGNGKISTGDMLLMQKIVLGITYDLPNNSSWRFVKEDHVFDDMNTVLDYNFPEYFTFTGEETEEDLKDMNFIAIKVGDLAGAYGAELQGGDSTPKALSLQTDNQALLPGAVIEVPIRAGKTRNLSGYQHAYQFDTDKIVFTGVEVGSELKLGGNNFGYQHLGDGYLTTSWFDTEDKNIEAGAVIYTLKFQVRESAQLKDVLSISSKYTQAESYFDNDRVGTVQFNFSEPVGGQLTLVNAPNPFKESTQVRFEAPAKGEAVIRVSDISGREVYRSELSAVKGENQLKINQSDLQTAGIYILKVELNGSSATQKIVMIE